MVSQPSVLDPDPPLDPHYGAVLDLHSDLDLGEVAELEQTIFWLQLDIPLPLKSFGNLKETKPARLIRGFNDFNKFSQSQAKGTRKLAK